ncbi:hypothetical protein [Marinobacter sp. CHS3-4]|uniref:hypothetical protein n=1 Tax=Marinobacter sp. CHS3-4 TaxID=3045174 RepID=UPI0024B58C1A|nr:hypothetical protein [Marinobacter sp. CHS3-4]MDI9246700.1 hypothetical protein [Marinobacter sp. CHS3-4]
MADDVENDDLYKHPLIHVVVVELHHHSDLIDNLIKVLRQERFRMTLITVKSVYDNMGHDWGQTEEWLEVFCMDRHEDVSSYIDRMAPVFKDADILYFNTVRDFWAELGAIPRSCPAMLRIHNAHADLAPASHFERPWTRFPGILSHLIRKVWIGGEWRKRKQFLADMDYVMFPNQAITDYVLAHGWIEESRVLPPVVPFAFLGESSAKPNDQNRWVTAAITGKVTNAKKDYGLVYQALKNCLPDLESPLRLILLGKAGDKQAEKIVADFKSLESDRFSLDYSTSFISPDEFEKKIAEVDFLLAPIRVQTHFRKYSEVYGKSKMSGIENDILLYRKPSIVTARYGIRGEMDKVVDYFEPTPQSLAATLTEWVKNKPYRHLQSHFDGMDQYRPEGVAKNFYRLCEALTSKTTCKESEKQ